jgi:acylphosphatase
MMIITKHLRIHGQVQGVGYRAGLVREAERLDLTGWVRNRADGSVEAVVQGPAAGVEALITWARRGPRLARVERVEIGEGEGVFPDFALLSTV